MTKSREDEEISIFDIVSHLGRHWKNILFVSFISACVGIASSFLMPVKYRSVAVLYPVVSSNAGGASGIGGLGGLASLAGLGGGGDHEKSLAILNSRFFSITFIEKENILKILFEERWNGKTEEWVDSSIFSIRSIIGGEYFDPKPTLLEANARFNDIRKIDYDPATGIIELSITWNDPNIAERWCNGLVEVVNDFMRKKAIDLSSKKIQYINEELAKNHPSEVKNNLSRLMEKELYQIANANVQPDYAFEILDPAMAPDKKSSPRRGMLAVMAAFIGFFVASLWYLWREKFF